MAVLAKAVFVRDPDRNRTVLLNPGEEPAAHLAALVTAQDAWEGGVLPSAEKDSDPEPEVSPEDTKPAARKTAAKKPARGRTTADEGNGGQ